MRSLLVIHGPYDQAPAMESLQYPSSSPELPSPDYVLRSNGYIVYKSDSKDKAAELARKADAAVFQLPISAVKDWTALLVQHNPLPILWWCDERAAAESLEACEDDVMIDGVLTPAMLSHELHWALHFGFKQFMERRQWLSEREELLGRIEERKWVDMAKKILCEIKGITESEAYDVLRKQAMNERKRMADVATSIVKVYQLLQQDKERGAKRR